MILLKMKDYNLKLYYFIKIYKSNIYKTIFMLVFSMLLYMLQSLFLTSLNYHQMFFSYLILIVIAYKLYKMWFIEKIILPQIIGIAGKKEHGKSTISKHLCEYYGYENISFAAPLKESCKIIFSLDNEQLYGNQKEIIDERWGVKPREIMQFVGTDLFRKKLGELIKNADRIWVLALLEKLKKNPNKRYVIDDIRFQNEIDAIKKFNNVITLRVKRNIEMKNDEHESEKNIENLINIDYDIANTDSKKSLIDKIDDFISKKIQI